jgi:hypothetical protein
VVNREDEVFVPLHNLLFAPFILIGFCGSYAVSPILEVPANTACAKAGL